MVADKRRRRRERPAGAYFAIAGVVAVILIIVIGAVATSLSRSEQPGNAQPVVDSGASPAPGAPDDRSDSPRLFVDTGLALTSEAELASLLAQAPPSRLPAGDATSELERLTEQVAIVGLADCLSELLSVLAPGLNPTEVRVGTWRGEPVFFVSGTLGDLGTPAGEIFVLSASNCGLLASATL